MSLADRFMDSAVRFGQAVVARVLDASFDPERTRNLERLERLYWGKQYEGVGLAAPWDKAPAGGPRVPLRRQRPSVQYDLPRPIVDRPTSLLFGEGRFPTITFEPADAKADASEVNTWLAAIADEGGLAHQCLVWARQGARTGSACMTWAIVEGEFEFQPQNTAHCTPTFHSKKRSRLIQLEKRYKYQRAVQELSAGYLTVREREFWHREVWDETSHVVFVDVLVEGTKEPAWTEAARVEHGFGFVPAVWVKNLDDGEPSHLDGISLLDGLADLVEDIDRTLSQKSRAVRYNQEPERVYLGLDEGERKKLSTGGGASTCLPKDGNVKLLELQGEGQTIAEAHVVAQRGRALETARVVLPEAERLLAAAKSGRALEILLGPMLELVGELRQSYGRALRDLLNQLLCALREGKLRALGDLETPAPAVVPEGRAKLTWGRFFDPTPEDVKVLVDAAVALSQAHLLDRKTLVRWLSQIPDFPSDIEAVLERVERELAESYGPMLTRPGKTPPTTETETDDEPTPGKGEGEGADKGQPPPARSSSSSTRSKADS